MKTVNRKCQHLEPMLFKLLMNKQYKDIKYILMFPNIILFVLIIHNGSYYGRQIQNNHEKLGGKIP